MSQTQPRISVIMPAFNVENYIETAVASVRNQTFTDWELIIVDDCSTDRTPDIARTFANSDSRIRYIRMDAPSGSAYQPRKTAIRHAQAAIVSPLDADDRIGPTCLEGMLSQKEQTGAAIVYPSLYLDSDNGERPHIPSDRGLVGTVMAGKDAVGFTLDGWRINCNGGLIDRNLYMYIYDNFDSTYTHACADEYLTRQLLYYADKVAVSPEKYHYRTNGDSITRRKTLKLFHFLQNNILLHSFISERYGRESDTCLRMHRQLFHGIYDAMRLENRYGFRQEELRAQVRPMMAACIRLIDWELIRRHESKKYYYLLKILQNHTDIARLIVKAGDKAIGKI